MARKWYAVRTYSGHENRVKKFIENEIAFIPLDLDHTLTF